MDGSPETWLSNEPFNHYHQDSRNEYKENYFSSESSDDSSTPVNRIFFADSEQTDLSDNYYN